MLLGLEKGGNLSEELSLKKELLMTKAGTICTTKKKIIELGFSHEFILIKKNEINEFEDTALNLQKNSS